MTFSPHPYCSRNCCLTSCIPLFWRDKGEGGKCQPPLIPSPPRPPHKKKKKKDIKGASVCRDRVSMGWRGWGSGGCSVSGKEQVPELPLSLQGSARRVRSQAGRLCLPLPALGKGGAGLGSHLSLASCLRSPGCKPQALGTEVPNRCGGCSSAPDPARHRHSPGPAATSGFCPGCSPLPWGQQRLRTDVWKGETQVYGLAAEKEPAARFAGDLLRAACSWLRWLQPSRRTGAHGSPAHAVPGLFSIPHRALEPQGLCSGMVTSNGCSQSWGLQPGPEGRLGPEAPASNGSDGTHWSSSPDPLIAPPLNDACRALEI